MKKSRKKITKSLGLLTLFFMLAFLFANSQTIDRSKNSISLGGGLSVPNITTDEGSGNYASNGSSFYIGYSRQLYGSKNGYLALEAKYSLTNNAYAKIDEDVASVNSGSNTSLGTWTGTSDSYSLKSYLLGVSWNNYLSKNNRFVSSVKVYLGSGFLVPPSETFNSSNGYYVKSSEVVSNSFLYSVNGGINYGITKRLFIGINLDFTKSSFSIENQQILYNGGSRPVAPYTVSYSNLNLNGELSFRF